MRTAALPALEPDALWRRLEQIVQLGNRFPGSEGEARCRRLVVAELERADLASVREEEFRYLGYEQRVASCALADGSWSLPAAPLQSTADAVAEGEAVYLGAGTAEDVAAVEARGVDLRGKVALAHSYWTFAVAPALAEKGVAALVNVAETPDGLVGHFPATLYPPPLEPPWEGRVLPVPGVTVEAARHDACWR